MEMECQVETGGGREETKTLQTPRMLPLIMGGLKRVAIPPSMEPRSKWQSGTIRRTGQQRREEKDEKGSGCTRQRQTLPVSLVPVLSTVQAVSTAN